MESRKLRNEFNLRSLLGRLVGTFGALFILAGLYSPFMTESSHKWDWSAAMGMMVFGIFLVFCATLIENPAALLKRRPVWFAAVSGFVCSCCVMASVVCLIVTWRSLPGEKPAWVRSVFALSMVCGVLSAIVCIITGIAALARRKVKHGENPFK